MTNALPGLCVALRRLLALLLAFLLAEQAQIIYAHLKGGIGIELPEGFSAHVCPRSGMAKNHGVTILNAPGVVDSDFRGEICAILINHGEVAYKIEPNQRIAQLVIAPVVRVELVQDGELSETERGEGGFGSTDK